MIIDIEREERLTRRKEEIMTWMRANNSCILRNELVNEMYTEAEDKEAFEKIDIPVLILEMFENSYKYSEATHVVTNIEDGYDAV